MKKVKINLASIVIEKLSNVTDFSKYKFLSEKNRGTNEAHIKALMVSFQTFGTAATNIVILMSSAFSGKPTLYIADGQHRIIAAGRLGLGLNVTIVRLVEDTPLNVTKYIAALNNSSKAWSTNNFMTAFANNGIYEYKKLDSVKSEFGFTITDLLYIFLGNGSGKENKMFKDGTLKFIDEADSDSLLKAVIKVKNVIPNKSFTRRSLYKMMRMAKDYDKFANAILKAAEGLRIAHGKFSENEGEFYNHLVRIYQAEFNLRKVA